MVANVITGTIILYIDIFISIRPYHIWAELFCSIPKLARIALPLTCKNIHIQSSFDLLSVQEQTIKIGVFVWVRFMDRTEEKNRYKTG